MRRPAGSSPLGRLRSGASVPGRVVTRGGAHAIAASSGRTATLANRDANNAVSLNDAIEDVAATEQLTEDGVAAIEVGLRGVRDEELTSSGVGSGERHAHRTPHIAMLIHLVDDRMARSAIAVTPRIPALHHKIRYNAVKALPVEVPRARQGDEVVHRNRR